MARKKQPKPRDQAAIEADQTSSDADEASATADVAATGRDDAASDREAVSAARDAAADARDQAAEEMELAGLPGDAGYEAAVQQAAAVRGLAADDRDLAAADRREAAVDREQATIDRKRAAADRRHAAMDREHAAMDRRQALLELEKSHKDDLTGAYRRGAGRTMIQREIDRAKRSGQQMVLAFVDVDDLKVTNDRHGHTAGDARLRDVVSAMRSNIRNYEPIVRYGGDEFLCSFSGVGTDVVQRRFDEIGALLAERENAGSISVGLAELRDGDRLQDLVDRADHALTEQEGSEGRD
jgi:diguanylate cyclase (GGDEF)-like protein